MQIWQNHVSLKTLQEQNREFEVGKINTKCRTEKTTRESYSSIAHKERSQASYGKGPDYFVENSNFPYFSVSFTFQHEIRYRVGK